MSNYELDNENYRGHTIRLLIDDYAESPRKWDNLGIIYAYHPRYNLGDIQCSSFWLETIMDAEAVAGFDAIETSPEYADAWGKDARYGSWDEALEDMSAEEWEIRALEALNRAGVYLPIYMYDHSGVTLNTTGFSCSWDSGQVGIIFASNEKIIQEYGQLNDETRAKAIEVLKHEVKIYDQFITGGVFAYIIEKPDGDIVESIWGIYDESEDAMQMARDRIDWEMEQSEIRDE